MPSKSKPPPTSITKTPHKTYPRKSKDPYPLPKPQETLPANISSVRKAPDPGRLLTKDPHPFPVAVSFFRSLHVVPLAQAGNPPATSCSRVRPRSLAQLPLSSPASSPSLTSQTDQNYPLSPHTQNTPKTPLPATIHVLNIYE